MFSSDLIGPARFERIARPVTPPGVFGDHHHSKGDDMRTKTPLQIGDRVAYSRAFLKSIGCYTGNLPFARGTIAGFKSLGETVLAEVEWSNDAPARVNVANLCKVGSVAFAD